MDGSEIESRLGARFSAPVHTDPGGTPSLLYNGYRVFSWSKAARGVAMITHLELSPRFKKEHSYTTGLS
jgi:hypothetical protein